MLKQINFDSVIDKVLLENRAYEEFFSLSSCLNAVMGRDGKFLYVNKAWEELLGFTVEELTSVPFFVFIHDRDVKRVRELYNDLLKGIEADCLEDGFAVRFKSKDGSYKRVSLLSLDGDVNFLLTALQIKDNEKAIKVKKI